MRFDCIIEPLEPVDVLPGRPPIAEIAARFDRTPASVTTMLQVLSRAPAPKPIPRSPARKFARGALELGTFLLLLGVCLAALVLL